MGEPNTDYCGRSGVYHTALHYAQVLAYANGGGPNDCIGTVNQVPSGWIGMRAQGIRDGASCGYSGYWYNDYPASNWQAWVNICSNPAGSQNFRTAVTIKYYTGQYYFIDFGPTSPIHAF